MVDRDGQQVVLLIRARPIAATGELSGVVADVTERRATETALRDLVDRYRLLVDLSPDAIVVHQMGIVRFVNPTGVEFVQLGSSGGASPAARSPSSCTRTRSGTCSAGSPA